MVSTAFSTKIPLTRELVNRLKPERSRYFLIFKDSRLRPPVLDEMMPDLQRVISTVAQRYCDSTTPHLQFDDLIGEGNVKLAEMITKGFLCNPKLPSRADFFKYFKAVANNHARSRVQKYRFTEKRTGQKPPPRDQRFLPATSPAPACADPGDAPEPVVYHKNVDLSLDDPELGLQVPDGEHYSDTGERDIDWGFSMHSAEYAVLLTSVERLVYKQLIAPDAHARCFAQLDAWRKSGSGARNIKIKEDHMAEGVGLSLELWKEAVLSIRKKIKAYRMATESELDKKARENAIVAQLKQVFGLHIPPDIDPVTVRRMLTMAARDQFDKLNTQLCELLTETGAKVPRPVGGDKIACYGVLYQKNCRPCTMCDLRQSCAVEAANLGLTKMVQSYRLLGVRQPRIPAFLPRTKEVSPQISNSDEAEIISQLDETFQRAERNGQTYYYHRVGDDKKRRYIFCVERTGPLRLRFCNPSETLKTRLEGKQKTWFAREGAPHSEVIELIEQHGKETFE